MNPSSNDRASDWGEYRRLVIAELERLNLNLEKIASRLTKNETDVELLKFKAGLWGAIAGAIPGALIAIGATLLKLV